MKYLLYCLSCFILFVHPAFAQPCNDTFKAGAVDPYPCIKTGLHLYADTIAGAFYQWSGPANFSSNMRNPSRYLATILMSGSYIVTATVGNCTYTDTVLTMIKAAPPRGNVRLADTVCDGDSVAIYVYTTGVADQLFLIDAFNNVYYSAGAMVKMINGGVYKGFEISTDGCTGDTGYYIANNVLPRPVQPTVSLIKPACAGDSLIMNIHSPDTAVSYRMWNSSGTLVSGIIPYITTANSGLYKIAAINSTGCTSDTALISVSVGKPAIPGVAIYGNTGTGPFGTVSFTSYVSKAGNSPEYRWMKNGIPIPGATGHTYTAVSGVDILPGDEITLQVKTDILPCPGTGTSNTLTISEDLSVYDKEKAHGFVVYPNPCNGIFTVVNAAGKQEDYTLTLVNGVGQQVYSSKASGSRYTFNAASLPSGMYTLRLQTASGSFSYKLAISR